MENNNQLIFKAKLIALPEKWNTHHYIVETDSEEDEYKYFYFSEAAQGKPLNIVIGTEGYIQYIINPGIPYWKDKIDV